MLEKTVGGGDHERGSAILVAVIDVYLYLPGVFLRPWLGSSFF